MRGWVILIVTLLVGAALGVAATVYVPPRVDPYLPNQLRLKSRVVEGQVVQKQRDGNRVLVKVQTDQGMILATFSKRAAEVDLLVEPGAAIALVLPDDAPVVDDPAIERVKRTK